MARVPARFAAFALAAGLAGAGAPAFAACGGSTVNIYRGGNTFVCHPDCGLTGRGTYALRSFRFEEPDSSGGFVAATNQCYAECARTPGCAGVQFSDWYEWRKGPAGPPGRHYMTCTLFGGAGGAETTQYVPSGRRGGGSDVWVCRRNISGRTPDFRMDTDRFFQDQHRPVVPGPSVPKKP